jgi:GT2 family glycosyltransferase
MPRWGPVNPVTKPTQPLYALPRHHQPTFSVVIPTYNRAAVLEECLDALVRQTFPGTAMEVFVCDDGSTDGTEGVVGSLTAPFPVTYLRQEHGGPAAARNLGVQAASGEFLLFINDDTVLEADAVASHSRAHAGRPVEKTAVLGTFSLPADAAGTPLGYVLQKSDMLFAYPRMTHGGLYGFNQFYTCNLSVPRDAVVEVGAFDEDFRGPAAEDLDLGYRLERHGFEVLFRSDCRGWHLHEISPRGFCRTHAARGYGAVTFMCKHPEVPFYPDLDEGLVERWRDEDRRGEPDMQAVVQRLESGHAGVDDADELDRKAAEASPLVRRLMVFHARRGMLRNPRLPALLERRRRL